jgi:hypothetical protein
MLPRSFVVNWAGNGEWSVTCNTKREAISLHSSRMDAWREARRLARGSGADAVLLVKNGEVLTRNSYEDDDGRGDA